MRSMWTARLAWLLAIPLLAVLPLALDGYQIYIVTLVLVNVVVAVGLNLLTGNAGQISLCHASFMAIGAYTTTLLMTNLGVPFLVALPTGGVAAAVLGGVLALAAIRLSGFYLALATLGFLEVTQIAIEEFGWLTGGVRGLMAPRPTIVGGIDLGSDLHLYYAVLIVTLFLVWVAYNLLESPVGRAFNAVRVSAAAVQTLGVSPARTKLTAFALAAFYAGIGGGLAGILAGFIDPTEYGTAATLRHITFIVLGGIGSLVGSIVGATVLTLLPEVLRGAAEYGDLFYAALLLGSLILMPKGLVGLVSHWTRRGPVLSEDVTPAQDREPAR